MPHYKGTAGLYNRSPCKDRHFDNKMTDEQVYELMKSAQVKDLEMVKYLLDIGVDVNSVDINGRTALMHACRMDNYTRSNKDYNKTIEIILLILKNGADVNLKDYAHRTCLMYAYINGIPETAVQVMRRCGADVELTDLDGNSANDYKIRARSQNQRRISSQNSSSDSDSSNGFCNPGLTGIPKLREGHYAMKPNGICLRRGSLPEGKKKRNSCLFRKRSNSFGNVPNENRDFISDYLYRSASGSNPLLEETALPNGSESAEFKDSPKNPSKTSLGEFSDYSLTDVEESSLLSSMVTKLKKFISRPKHVSNPAE